MNDYLGNLVARTLGQMPAVEPRLASRFEQIEPASPFQNATGTFQQRDTEPLEIEKESLSESSNRDQTIRPARRIVSAKRVVEPDGSLERDNDDDKFFQDVPVSGMTSIRTSQSQPGVEQVLPSLQTEQIVASPVALNPNLMAVSQIRPGRVVDAIGNFADPPFRGQEGLNQSETLRAGFSQRTDRKTERDREKSDGQPPQSVSRVEPQPPIEWLPQAASMPPVSSPIPAIERKPVIKVTIGRVEVRAVMSAPTVTALPTAEQSPRIQSLPLSEYLRRRNNGEL